ncbi:SPOR domain-containing protein [Sulfurospirillum diekertiae]|uniref:SPOR domain-containing protein n=1 Tax=Sulfurospirillum diekertiae TaxID=1854492 RepID=A0A6G9VVD5_9BACT|nr:SPOR domain-containing protein [Sulfurospirillum diekertiae]QIR76629.1 SPOR domain-containing protein [Sulfurospirillum diekertiae]QIR79258.1 SPOR domain-containing protein [Sulfurospirillum diekertiae]
MENRNELSDIVLEKGDNKTVKMKRILILVAFLILVFLVALASMKVANKDQGKDTSKLILPPEPTQETQIPKDDQLFKQVPIIEENPKKESFEDMIKTLKDKEAQKQEDAKGSDVKPKETTTTTPTASTPVKEPAPAKVKEEPKKEAAKPQQMLRSTEVAPSTPSATSGSTVSPGIYVQVGAVATAPDAKQLSDIKSKGFDCKTYATVVNGNKVVKLLIGPYATSAEAENALSLIRSSVNKNAFIYRVK